MKKKNKRARVEESFRRDPSLTERKRIMMYL
jgi:hypothetical protein